MSGFIQAYLIKLPIAGTLSYFVFSSFTGIIA